MNFLPFRRWVLLSFLVVFVCIELIVFSRRSDFRWKDNTISTEVVHESWCERDKTGFWDEWPVTKLED
jgi:hypothetical protein